MRTYGNKEMSVYIYIYVYVYIYRGICIDGTPPLGNLPFLMLLV